MPETLLLTRKFLKVLKVLTWAYGGGILALLIASFTEPEWFFRAIGVKEAIGAARIGHGLQMIAVLGLVTIPINVRILDRLIAMVDTVRTVEQPLEIGRRFSFTPALVVLLLFVLAKVFEHGARMRADLEGTV